MGSPPDGTNEARRRYNQIAGELRDGKRHPTLGFHPDRGEGDWWQAGRDRFDRVVESFAIRPHHRVIDYGCGSLRLGGHFMRHLDRGNYFGLDAAEDLIAIGRELMGEGIIADRLPHLAVIDARSLAAAETFRASFVISEAVDYHVVRDELGFYYDALRRLAHMPGCALLLSVRIADAETEFSRNCWARPMEHFIHALAPLVLAKAHFRVPAGGGRRPGVESATLEFRRG